MFEQKNETFLQTGWDPKTFPNTGTIQKTGTYIKYAYSDKKKN